MIGDRRILLEKAAQRGKYSPLYRHLIELRQDEWSVNFRSLEKLLGFDLPDSARIYRPWWANVGVRGGHSHALAWEMAGWRTSQVDMAGEKLVFVRQSINSSR